MNLSVVLSFRNEEATIDELIKRLATSIESIGLSYEIIFVNDASTDSSLEILTRHGTRDSRIKTINMSRNFGNAPCALAGFRYASGEAVLVMDADLQDPPELIPQLWAEYKKGADVVYTTRLSRAGEGAFKMLITKWAYRILKAVGNKSLPVDSGDFKLMSKRVVRELCKLEEYDPFLRGLVTWVGFKQVPVYYHREARHSGETHYPLIGRGPLRAFISGLTSFSTFPLELALIFGFLMAVLSMLYLCAVVTMFFLGWNIPGWTALMGVILILGASQLITTGVLGLYLGRVYNTVKGRPNFIVESTINFTPNHKELASESSPGCSVY